MNTKIYILLTLSLSYSQIFAQFNSERASRRKMTHFEIGVGYGSDYLKWDYSNIKFNNLRLPDHNKSSSYALELYSISISHGWTSSKKLFMGPSIGIDNYRFIGKLLPVGIDLRKFYRYRNLYPYIGLKAGYSISVFNGITPLGWGLWGLGHREELKGGLYLSPTIGYQIRLSRKNYSKFNLNIGYRYQKVKVTEVYELFNRECTNFQSWTVMTGISF